MPTRTAAFSAVLVAAGLALAGCGGGSDDPTAGQTTSSLPIGSQLNSPRPPIGTATQGRRQQVFDYWKQQLPAAGYTIGKAEMVGGIGEISFTGNGCADGSQLGISGPTVAFACQRG